MPASPDHDPQSPPRPVTSSNPTPRDVRMKGFVHRALVGDVLDWLRGQALPREPETVLVAELSGRVLGQPIDAPIDVPSFDRSAMDGYAVQAAATDGAGLYNPLSFAIVGESLPGSGFSGTIDSGSAVRIMTGAPVPSGATCVVPAEHASETDDRVEITTPVPVGRHIGRRGEDVTVGQRLLETGRRLRPQDVALIGSLGLDRVEVIRQPRVRLLITGDELVTPGGVRRDDQIFESNSLMLAGLVQRDGGLLENSSLSVPVADQRPAIARMLTEPGADVILVSGGSSVGTEDHAPTLVAEVGELTFHGVAMRPSSPAGVGRVGEALVFLLPGNPVSCLCAYDVFAGEAIRRQGGLAPGWPYQAIEGVLDERIASDIGRLDYCRVSIEHGSPRVISPLAISGASILSSTTRADGFVVVPADLEGYASGCTIRAWLYDPPSSGLGVPE